jgi:murein DD-endopeptidase MepM/ murein hydrolase activator NlpD
MHKPANPPPVRSPDVIALSNPRLAQALYGVTLAALLGAVGFGLGLFCGGAAGGSRTAAAPPPVPMGGPLDPSGPTRSAAGNDATDYAADPQVLPAPPLAVSRDALVADRIARAPGQPTRLPVLGGWVSSGYGQRPDPFTGRPAPHRGLDFAGLEQSAILAAGAGVVTWSGRRQGYGNLIEIDHGNGLVTRYAHNKKNLVEVGDAVKKGEVIGLVGSTGRSTAPHVHLEVLQDGRVVNPRQYVR